MLQSLVHGACDRWRASRRNTQCTGKYVLLARCTTDSRHNFLAARGVNSKLLGMFQTRIPTHQPPSHSARSTDSRVLPCWSSCGPATGADTSCGAPCVSIIWSFARCAEGGQGEGGRGWWIVVLGVKVTEAIRHVTTEADWALWVCVGRRCAQVAAEAHGDHHGRVIRSGPRRCQGTGGRRPVACHHGERPDSPRPRVALLGRCRF